MPAACTRTELFPLRNVFLNSLKHTEFIVEYKVYNKKRNCVATICIGIHTYYTI